MTLTRRRFLTLSAAMLAAPAHAGSIQHWRGRAFGADLEIRLSGASFAAAQTLWRAVTRQLEAIERQVSLYRASEVLRLNTTGVLVNPGADMRQLVTLSDQAYRATKGAFDPTVQALWLAHAEGTDPKDAQTGWQRVQYNADGLRLPRGMALTFNGIAQGYAADRVAALLRARGFGNVLIDMGEVQALGAPDGQKNWPVQIAGPDGGVLQHVGLRDRALATSSPAATRVGPQAVPHILHPDGRKPLWQTVAVSADCSAVADALSTAFCLMPRPQIDAALAQFPQARLETLI
jgi:FAD:protein FMN transferase